MRLSDQLMQGYVEAECPVCEYPFEFQIIDARTQVYRHCPCCRTVIHLIDHGGSTYGALEDVDNAMNDLNQQLRRMFG